MSLHTSQAPALLLPWKRRLEAELRRRVLDVVGPDTQFVCHEAEPDRENRDYDGVTFYHICTTRRAGQPLPTTGRIDDSPLYKLAEDWLVAFSGDISGVPATQYRWRQPPEINMQMDFETEAFMWICSARITLWPKVTEKEAVPS